MTFHGNETKSQNITHVCLFVSKTVCGSPLRCPVEAQQDESSSNACEAQPHQHLFTQNKHSPDEE